VTSACAAAILLAVQSVLAQLENPVYVDDSPQARELFLRAQDQIKDNAGEAVRLLQELLDEYGPRLLPINAVSEDHFVAVRQRVIDEIASQPALLERYQVLQAPEAQRLLDAGELDRLALTRSLTEPGLEAMMRLAQDALEAARFHVALRWIDEISTHPMRREKHQVYALMMQGIAGRGIGLEAMVERSLVELGAFTGPEAEACRAQIEAIAAAAIPSPDVGVTPLDRASVGELQTLVSQPIWRSPLDTGAAAVQPPSPDDLDPELSELMQQRDAGRLDAVTATATVGQSTVFVTSSTAVHALDRYTGRSVWNQPYTLSPAPGGSFNSEGIAYLGLSVSSLGSQSLVAVSSDPRLRDGRVVCLDPLTGQERWSRSITEVAGREDTENIMPHGAPVIAEGLVFIMARKVTRQLLTSCYVVALEIDTGEIRWSRHVASVGGTFNRDMRPLTSVVYDRGDLYVDSSVGAVARIDASTGLTRWLRRFTAPITAIGRGRAPFELGGAVVTHRGVFALQSDLNRVTLLDRENGFDVEWHDASTTGGWGSPRYLLAGGDFVYAVGRDIRAFHLDNLAEPFWRLPEATPQGRLRSGLGDRNVDIRGRVQLVEGSLIVPTADGMLIVEDESGVIQHELAMDSLGNPVALESQLVVAGRHDVSSYMPFNRAEEILRQRIASEPSEPRPALALLEMSIRARNLALVLEAAGLARAALGQAAVDAAQQSQRELFSLLLEADRQRLAKTAEEGESLHALIGDVAFDAATRVEHLLAKADWLTSVDLGRAVDTYQEILSDQTLASSPREESLLIRSAADAATQRLASLMQTHGDGVYSAREMEAQQKLLSTLALPHSRDDLVSIVREFPLSTAAMQASIEAAEIDVADGNPRAAIAALLQTYRAHPDRDRAAALLGHVVDVCQSQQWLDLASGILEYASHRYPGIQLEAADPAMGRIKSSGPVTGHLLHDAARPLSGRLIEFATGSGGEPTEQQHRSPYNRFVPPADRIPLIDGRVLRMFEAPSLTELWNQDIGEADPRLLLLDDSRILLWLGTTVEDPHAIMLRSGRDGGGEPLWPGPSLRFNDAFGGRAGNADDLGDIGRMDVQAPDGRLINRNEILPLVDRERLILVRRTGDVAALDLETGQKPLWTAANVLHQVHLAQVTDWALIVAGVSMVWNDVTGANEPASRIVVLDPATGKILATLAPSGREPVVWMRIAALGELLIGTTGSVELLDLMGIIQPNAADAGGESRHAASIWTNAGHYAQSTRRAWVTSAACVIEDRNRMVRAIDHLTGGISEPFDVAAVGEQDETSVADLVDVQITPDAVATLYTLRVVLTDEHGVMLGGDVIAEEREYKALESVNKGWVLVSRHGSAQDILADGRSRRTQHTYRLYNLSMNGALIGEALELEPIAQRLQAVRGVDGWLILSFEDSCVAIQAPANP
jgi:outer membrane protein assembly factor BamB